MEALFVPCRCSRCWVELVYCLGTALQGGSRIVAARGPSALPSLAMSSRFASSGEGQIWEFLRTEKRENGVAVVRLHRPDALNALSGPLMGELVSALRNMDNDPEVKAVVLTGSERAFAAGADIKEMKDKNYAEVYKTAMLEAWSEVSDIRKPIVAGVNGFALGGGCELAMMCDIIIAGENAVFGQPEIQLGTIPGAGGTQRLTRVVGKSLAMEMCLTGSRLDAHLAEKRGLVSRVVPTEQTVDEGIKVAEKIAQFSTPVIIAAKDCVNQSQELSLQQGLKYEKALFWSTFALSDRLEGMTAFKDKRKPNFTDE
ncbi:enoyl-CoA hydratase/isomerase [Chloropicon primus]|uniref:Probable enoyl-CoA hydratase, mitochondrial n=1 Tax=Chloropicon primus TaxID=1764295 RepID=A0A5B8MMT0_9CHLO|nr:enoyl-CoA hydratase/isomerase [Chloropicon primus]|eukprot:QDZ21813.1 enoyl-CoA hydratase/isomerase [Chloropicon primus]